MLLLLSFLLMLLDACPLTNCETVCGTALLLVVSGHFVKLCKSGLRMDRGRACRSSRTWCTAGLQQLVVWASLPIIESHLHLMFWGACPQAHALSERCRIVTFIVLSLLVGDEVQSLWWHCDKEVVCLICISATPLWYSLTSVLVPLLFVRSDKMSCKCRCKIRHETGYGSTMHFVLFPNSLYLAQIVKLVVSTNKVVGD